MLSNRPRSSFDGRTPYTPMNEDELRQKAARLYKEQGTVMIKPEWLHNDFDRQHLQNVAEKLFGRRV